MTKLTFIKMDKCGHCMRFYAEGKNNGPWMTLKNDKDLKVKGVQFEVLQFDPKDENSRKVVSQFKNARYFPYFSLEVAGQNLEYGRRSQTPAALKQWILSNLNPRTQKVEAVMKSKKASNHVKPKRRKFVSLRTRNVL